MCIRDSLNTTATMSKEMKTFYEKRLIDQAEPRLVHDQFADYYLSLIHILARKKAGAFP